MILKILSGQPDFSYPEKKHSLLGIAVGNREKRIDKLLSGYRLAIPDFPIARSY